MQEQEIELAIGDTLQIGDYLVTVVDIEGLEVSFRVDTFLAEEPEVECLPAGSRWAR